MFYSSNRIILIFHGIGVPRPELPAEEHPYWIAGDFFEQILQLVAERKSEQDICLTFDDGNDSDLFAAEQLIKYGLGGKFFLLTERFGKQHYVTREDASGLDKMGMEVGLHGYAHVDWRRSSQKELERETIEARKELETAVGKKVSSVAIPFGAYNRRVLRHLREQNFDNIYTSDAGPATSGSLFQRRTSITSDYDIDDVIALLDDNVGLMKRVRRTVVPIIKSIR